MLNYYRCIFIFSKKMSFIILCVFYNVAHLDKSVIKVFLQLYSIVSICFSILEWNLVLFSIRLQDMQVWLTVVVKCEENCTRMKAEVGGGACNKYDIWVEKCDGHVAFWKENFNLYCPVIFYGWNWWLRVSGSICPCELHSCKKDIKSLFSLPYR